MTYDGTTLNVTITDTVTQATASQSYAVNIPSLVGGNTAYVGFTGGTGDLTAVQKILNWTYTPASTLARPAGLTATPGNGPGGLGRSSAPGAASYNIPTNTGPSVNGTDAFFSSRHSTTTRVPLVLARPKRAVAWTDDWD